MEKDEKTANPGCLKNKGVFSFLIGKQIGVKTTNQPTFASNDNAVQVFLNGVIYEKSEAQLVEGFLTLGVDYIKNVEGSFVIFLIDGTGFYILTDKVNSKKAFYALLDDVWYISNNIDALPKHICQLSMQGLACYLANGIMYNDITLFQEIKSAKRASVHLFRKTELSIRCYWNFRFSYSSNSNIEQQKYEHELEIIINS